MSTALAALSSRISVSEDEAHKIIMRTLVSAKGNAQVTADEFVTFLAIANEYRLNPLTKEIYAFVNRGTIQPIVSIDGWLSIINGHPQFDGMEFADALADDGSLISVTCRIYRKDRSRCTEVMEYMAECRGTSEPWKKWPARMLRHKATIQAARYAFGLSGIYDPDEADRIAGASIKEINDVAAEKESLPFFEQTRFEEKLPEYIKRIQSGKKTAQELIAFLSTKYTLTYEQIAALKGE